MIIMDKEKVQATYSNTKLLFTAILWIFVAIAICILWVTKSFLIFIVICVLISKIERHWERKFNAFLVPRWMTESVKGATLFRIFIMALSQQWSLCLMILSVVVLVFTSVSVRLLLDPPRTLDQMIMSNGHIERIKEGRIGPRSSNKDYLFIRTDEGEKLNLYSIYTPEQLATLHMAKENNEKVTFWYRDKGALFKDKIWELRKNNETIQKYNEPLVRKRYNQNKKSLIVLTIYLLVTYFFITVYFYIKLKQEKGD